MITTRIDVRERLFAKDNGICGICGEPVAFIGMHLDHIIPICVGGPDSEENLQIAHASCNFSKGGEHKGIRPNQKRAMARGPVVESVLRIPESLWLDLKAWAKHENRSINGQIVYVIRRALTEWRDNES